MIMKKSVLILVLGIVILVVGCGKADVDASYESQIVEDSNITVDTETDGETDTQTESEQVNVSNDDINNELDDYMTSTKEKSDIIKNSLEQEEMTQMDMNGKAQELYMVWDDALNYLWDELKNCLSEEEFSKLLDEQRIWIAEKEKSVEEAGKEVEGGSLYSFVMNMEAAKITEARVYELYELLK